MTKPELLQLLADCVESSQTGDPEAAHKKADAALLAFIGDESIAGLFNRIVKYYS